MLGGRAPQTPHVALRSLWVALGLGYRSVSCSLQSLVQVGG
jgi:hypothetical protein